MKAVFSCLNFQAWHHPNGKGFCEKVVNLLYSNPKRHFQWNLHYDDGDVPVSGGDLTPRVRGWLERWPNWHRCIGPRLTDGHRGHAW